MPSSAPSLPSVLRTAVIGLAALAVALSSAACSSGAATPTITGAWVRPPQGMDRPAAGYLVITGGPSADALLTPETYSMTHTANVYLVDQQGLLRAIFPFGTQPDAMLEVVRAVLATPAATVYPPTPLPTSPSTPTPTVLPTVPPASLAPSVAPTSVPTAGPTAGALRAELVSSSVWAGGASPVILAL